MSLSRKGRSLQRCGVSSVERGGQQAGERLMHDMMLPQPSQYGIVVCVSCMRSTGWWIHAVEGPMCCLSLSKGRSSEMHGRGSRHDVSSVIHAKEGPRAEELVARRPGGTGDAWCHVRPQLAGRTRIWCHVRPQEAGRQSAGDSIPMVSRCHVRPRR